MWPCAACVLCAIAPHARVTWAEHGTARASRSTEHPVQAADEIFGDAPSRAKRAQCRLIHEFPPSFRARLRDGADVAREFHRQIEQRFIGAMPTDEGETDRTTRDRTHWQRDLRQSAQAGKTGQSHDANAKRLKCFSAAVDARGNAWRRRQRENGSGLD